MHYGHPDVFDRTFHITRGGISKASRVINISEDIYAGWFHEHLASFTLQFTRTPFLLFLLCTVTN